MEAPQHLLDLARRMAEHPAHQDEIHVVWVKDVGVFGTHSDAFLQQRGRENFEILATVRKGELA